MNPQRASSSRDFLCRIWYVCWNLTQGALASGHRLGQQFGALRASGPEALVFERKAQVGLGHHPVLRRFLARIEDKRPLADLNGFLELRVALGCLDHLAPLDQEPGKGVSRFGPGRLQVKERSLKKPSASSGRLRPACSCVASWLSPWRSRCCVEPNHQMLPPISARKTKLTAKAPSTFVCQRLNARPSSASSIAEPLDLELKLGVAGGRMVKVAVRLPLRAVGALQGAPLGLVTGRVGVVWRNSGETQEIKTVGWFIGGYTASMPIARLPKRRRWISFDVFGVHFVLGSPVTLQVSERYRQP